MSGASGAPPILWFGMDAVQLTVPRGDDGQLMSGASDGPPVRWLSSREREREGEPEKERERETPVENDIF